MDPASRAAQRARVEAFARARPGALLLDPAAGVVLDVASGKALPLDWSKVVSVEERTDRESRRPYLAVARDDGSGFALADQGIAFAPATASTGPIAGLPAAVCFRDLAAAEARLSHFLLDHPGEPPAREHVSLFLFCLALVEGARAVGFDVGPEERRLERLLNELEARKRG